MKNQTTITEYMRTHMLTAEVVERYGIGTTGGGSFASIYIPVRDPKGVELFRKYRMFEGPDKYRYDRGSSMALFDAHRILPETETVWVVEGEFDCMALNDFFLRIGMSGTDAAVTSTGGAGTWKEEWNGLVRGKVVALLLDSDPAGIAGSVRLWEKMGAAASCVLVYSIARHKDVCELLHSGDNFGGGIALILGGSRFSMRNVANAANATARAREIRRALACLDDEEAKGRGERALSYISAFRAHLAAMYGRERPRRRPKSPYVPSDGDDPPLDAVRAVPITRFVRFDRQGVARCVFHAETNPSMRYNPPGSRFPNTVKCYSCGRFGGVIDVVMQINRLTFSEAVALLKKEI